MDIENLINEIKSEGYSKPKVGLVTPEIRTIDECVASAIKFIEDEDWEE